VIAQFRSLVEVTLGDAEAARETQRQFGSGVSDFADMIPVVGHVKGGIHYAVGDKENGDNSMKAASRSTGVVAGGVGGFFVGGPVGAVAGGVTGGLLLDGVITSADSLAHMQFRPAGTVNALGKVMQAPSDAGVLFDAAVSPIIGSKTEVPFPEEQKLWHEAAERFIRKLTMPGTMEELISFLVRFGYKFNDSRCRGSCKIYKFEDLHAFLKEMPQVEVPFVCVAEYLTVNSHAPDFKGTVRQTFGLVQADHHTKFVWYSIALVSSSLVRSKVRSELLLH
jgi:hypothetical protein